MNRSTQRDAQLAQVLVRFAHTLGTDFSIQRTLDRLVESVVSILPVDGAGVMLMGERQQLHFIATSDEKVMEIERLQNRLGEGPCLEAYRFGLPVALTDLRTDTRFPRFSPEAVAAGMEAVFTFPLTLDDERLGALDLYCNAAGALDNEDLKAAQTLADVASAYLFNAQARIDASAAIARLNHNSLHDQLTGLPNRTLFEERLEQAMARAIRSQHVAAVLFVDLDGFKAVNDRHGHHIGDQLLRAIAGRITRAIRPGDTAARLGGDEFVILCEDLHDVTDAELVARRLTDAVAKPFDLEGKHISITASVGIAYSGLGNEVPHELLRDADFAMYQAKVDGGGRLQVLDPAARLAANRHDQLETDLVKASDREQLSLMYQPILDIHSGELLAVEALLRWQHPDRGAIPPDTFIPSAERTGYILPLGEWVLRQACRDFKRWQDSGLAVPSIAVNVSAHQVMGPAFAHTVERALELTGVDPHALVLEVTESVFMTDASRAATVLQEVKNLGVGLTLDDFGTGYASPNSLRQLPFDSVKIDRSFTEDVPTSQVTRTIASSMVNLGHILNLSVTAEGIETAEELAAMTELGADHAQGFHLSHPLNAADVETYADAEAPAK